MRSCPVGACGLAHVGLGPRQCAATPLLPFAAPVGIEMVSGTPGDGVRAFEVATVAKVFLSGIFMVFEWKAAMVLVSVGYILMNNGDVLEVPCPCVCFDDAETTCSSCACGYLCGDDSCSLWSLLPSPSAFSPLSRVFCPLRCPSCALLVSFRDAKDPASKVCGKIAKVKWNPFVFSPERMKPRPRL